jgi:hypothetical protein
VRRIFIVWLALSALLCAVVAARARLAYPEPVSPAARAWAFQTIEAAMAGAALPEPVPDAKAYRAEGPVIVIAWGRGRVLARHVSTAGLAGGVAEAATQLAANMELRAAASQLVYTITLTRERAPWFRSVPMLAELSVVPFVEGVTVTLADKVAHATPDEITSAALWDNAVKTPIPDLTFGLSPRAIAKLVAKQLVADEDTILRDAQYERVASLTLTRAPYPSNEQVTVETLHNAAREGAVFLLKHQDRGGRFTYRYDGRRNRELKGAGYSLPRHAGTAFFLAQAARALDMPAARQGALAALRFVRENVLKTCGSEAHACVAFDDRPDMGAAALTALAAAEVLAGGDDPEARELLVRLTAFIRSMQRKDGELMHVYDLKANEPIDIQKMYYSGEAAVALLAAHRVLGDPRDLEAVRPLMSHLTGTGWSFFGSRYFYGEEHWTCQAVAAAADRMEVGDALDFCLRWLGYQRALLYAPGETPWPVAGAIGVGPVIVPRLTSVASRVEAGALIYTLAKSKGHDVAELGAQMEAHLGLLMRMRFAPGPVHLMRDPFAARGGIPATQGSLEVRNDFVQHAGSAMLAWADVLQRRQ